MLSSKVWDNYEHLRDVMGDTALLEALAQALGTNDLQENLEHIADCRDIELPEQD